MLLPATTVAGPLLVMATSAEVLIAVVCVEVLLPGAGSALVDETVAVFEMFDAFGATWPTSVNVADAPELSTVILQLTVAPPVQVNAGPDVWAIETKVTAAG